MVRLILAFEIVPCTATRLVPFTWPAMRSLTTAACTDVLREVKTTTEARAIRDIKRLNMDIFYLTTGVTKLLFMLRREDTGPKWSVCVNRRTRLDRRLRKRLRLQR